jgi:23S rRNA (cytidine1920-2'-O)/16S rRNA (cytidine1409-2'-O)-methyltransferase
MKFNIAGLKILDVGCSTGGFADFFLRSGAAAVTGIDIAKACVHEHVLRDPSFSFFGGLDARDTKAMKTALGKQEFDIIAVDVSTVALKDVLPGLKDFLSPGGIITALFKPPYETGKRVSSKAGLAVVSKELMESLGKEYELIGTIDSPLRGGAGNRGTMELFFVLRKKK